MGSARRMRQLRQPTPKKFVIARPARTLVVAIRSPHAWGRIPTSAFVIDVPGTGIVFLVPLSAVGGKRQLELLLGDQDFLKGEESALKNTEQELIVVISNQGYSEQIMNAARSAKAGGGTVIHAKGTGKKSEKFYGFVLAEEKEMHYIVVSAKNRDAVMQAIMEQAGMRTKAQAVCFALPVTAVAGMRLIRPPQDEEEGKAQ